jgi:thymidylate synthase (FAD)
VRICFHKGGVFPQGLAPSDEGRLLQLIELCGRTAYKSEDKITDDSAKAFVLMLKKHGHLSVLEHSNIVLKIEAGPKQKQVDAAVAFAGRVSATLLGSLRERNAYHRVYSMTHSPHGAVAIAANLRGWLETLGYLKTTDGGFYSLFSSALSKSYPVLFESVDPPAEEDPFRISLMNEEEQLATLKKDPASDLPVFVFKFVCDRGITHEVVRHRVLSFTQESTRYVNYKNKGMVLILPEEIREFYDSEKDEFVTDHPLVKTWIQRAETIFEWYQADLHRGLRAEIARDILPNLLKSDLLVSGRWSGWRHFIQLRDSQHAHPRIRAIAREVRAYFDSLGVA